MMDNGQMDSDDHEDLLFSRIGVEQLLLAANVLSAQNPQVPDFDRKKLLEDAHEFALEAQEAAFMIPLGKNSAREQWMRYFVKFGYDRPGEHEFVPYPKAAMEITGLRTEKAAVPSNFLCAKSRGSSACQGDSALCYTERADRAIPSRGEQALRFSPEATKFGQCQVD